jgi:hypothetical protein
VLQITPILKLVLFLIFVTVSVVGLSQERCGTVEYMKKIHGENLHRNGLNFEQWLERKIRLQKGASGNRQQAINQVPVVVHVIHNGEAVGTGKNISDAQILSQIEVLNEDYQRMNADASDTPAEFQSVAGSIDLEFVLAKQDPEGLATNGIVRVAGPKSSWTINDNYEIKSLSYWPADDYLNIWVCNLSGLLGYAQFPVSNLPGLENSSDNALTDGVVIAYNAFGSIEDGAFPLLSKYNQGRTTTHELGHFFGLRHTWGDDEGECSGTDYVNDTPNQGGSSSGCPNHPQTTCSVTAMFQNYLDYTDDACMNLFTQDQVSRMIAVLENSPRRASLLTSPGLQDPAPVANDLGIKEITSPLDGECNAAIVPVIEVRNYGSNAVTSARIRLIVNGVIVETKDFSFGPLANLQSVNLSFASVDLGSGLHTVAFELLLTNGVADARTSNNSLDKAVTIPENISVPFTENFNTLPSAWQVLNPDLKTTWTLAATPDEDPGNQAMKMDFFNYEDNLGEIDLLITPTFDLTTEPVAILLFDVAYARYQNDNDGLKVVVLTNCNTDITQGTVVYDKSGANLETSNSTTSEFIPSNEEQWRSEFIDLSGYIGQSNLQLAFVGVNDWGNNLYIDNISLVTNELNDLALEEILSPQPVVCSEEIIPRLRIQNKGTPVTSFKVRVTVNATASTTQTFSDLNFLSDTSMDIALSPVTLSGEMNTLSYEVLEPSGLPDVNSANNTQTTYVAVNQVEEQIPIRQNFEGSFEEAWTRINPKGGMTWEPTSIGTNNTLYYNAFNNLVIGERGWLVSPVLDFSGTTEASLYFNLSYATRASAVDRLQVMASLDCGQTYADTLLSETGTLLANDRTSSSQWQPDTLHWSSRTINLSSFGGKQNVRIAFVFTSRNGNNIYLDNIEFFTNKTPVISNMGLAVYTSTVNEKNRLMMTFGLDQKGPVDIDVMDVTGKILMQEFGSNILNQSFEIPIDNLADGVYIVRARTNEGVFTRRVLVFK